MTAVDDRVSEVQPDEVIDLNELLAEAQAQNEQIAQLRQEYRECVGSVVQVVETHHALEVARARAVVLKQVRTYVMSLPDMTVELASAMLGPFWHDE